MIFFCVSSQLLVEARPHLVVCRCENLMMGKCVVGADRHSCSFELV